MRASIGLVLAAAVLAGGCDRRSGAGEQGNVVAAADTVSPDEAPPAAAPVAAGTIDRSHKGTPAPGFAFQNAAGKAVTLAAFRGTPVLLNLWATWCGPCVKELPTLDALARTNGKLRVVALSQDTDPAKVAPFLFAHGVRTLQPFTDGRMAWLPAVTANLPTSILFDSNGREVWRTLGDLDWTGKAATAALAEGR